MATMDWIFINKMALVASQAINCQRFWPNLMVWNKPRWSNGPFWFKKMLNFPKIKNINPSNLVVLPHNHVILVVHQSFKKMFCGGVHFNALHNPPHSFHHLFIT
jgi:hypothetical protein